MAGRKQASSILDGLRSLEEGARDSLVNALLSADDRQAVIITNADARILHWNSGAETIFGWTAAEAIGRTTVELMQPDPDQATESFAALRRGEARFGRMVLRRKDSEERSIETVTRPFHGADGQVAGYIGSSRDVTEQSRTQRALRESEAMFSELMANLRVGIWLFDMDGGEIEYVSPGYEAMFSVTLEEMRRSPWKWLDRVHPDDRERVQTTIEEHPVDFEVEYRFVRPDGTVGIARGRAFPVFGAAGARRRVAGITNDITDLRNAEDELRQVGAALDQTGDGILLLDANGVAVYVNQAYTRMTGFTREQVIGQVPPAMPGTNLDPEMIRRAGRGETWRGNVRTRRRDGTEYVADVTIWPVRAPEHGAPRFVVTARDVSVEAGLSEALAEEARARTELVEAVSRLSECGTPDEIASAVCEEALRIPGVDSASVLGIDPDGTITTIGFRAPPGAPLRIGEALPATRASYLAERARLGAWVEDWHPRRRDGAYATGWSDVSLTSAAYLPILVHGELAGLLVCASLRAGGGLSLSDRLPVLRELSTISGALLADHLVARLRNGALRARVEAVIRDRQFSIAFQPVVDLASSTTVGYEALSRFSDGTPPERFFADATLAGVGLDLEEATVSMAVADADDLAPGAWLAVNVSPDMAADLPRLRRALNGGSRPIVLEITEQMPIADYSGIHRAIAKLQPRVRLAVDDAGAGFASLRHILELSPQFVKLDIGLVRGIGRDAARQALVAGMVYYAGSTGCALIAEGIETEAERRTLRRLGVTFGQGFLLGRPAPARWPLAALPRESEAVTA